MMIINCTGFRQFGQKVLLTNDLGNYVFLTHEEFKQFREKKLTEDSSVSEMLIEKGFLSFDTTESFVRKEKEKLQNAFLYLFQPTSLFIIAVTNHCNERCLYCQAHGNRSGSFMSEETAKMVIKRIKESPATNIAIEFQGGEPLANFPAIKVLVEESRKKLYDRKIGYALVSNLSLLTDEQADFIRDYHISVSTSLDGPMWLHDKNRPMVNGNSSYHAMLTGKEKLLKRGVNISAIETTTRYTLEHSDELIDEYVKQGYRSIFIRPLSRIGSAAAAWDKIGYTPDEYLCFYRKALKRIIEINKQGIPFAEQMSCILLRKILGYPAANYMDLRSPCGAGIGQLAITYSGDVYTCDEGRMIAETGDQIFRMGSVFQNGYNEWMESNACKAVVSASLLDTLPACSQCAYKPYCGVCPVLNYAINKDLRSCRAHGERCRIYEGIIDCLFEYLYNNDEQTIDIFHNWIRNN